MVGYDYRHNNYNNLITLFLANSSTEVTILNGDEMSVINYSGDVI